MTINFGVEFQGSNWYLNNETSKHVIRNASKMMSIEWNEVHSSIHLLNDNFIKCMEEGSDLSIRLFCNV